jgi:hypothetical protein
MWFLRRMMRISWTAKKTNVKIIFEANEQRHTYYCRPEKKTGKVYRSFSSKEEAGRHRDNRKNM